MTYNLQWIEHTVALETGDIFYAGDGCEHVVHPRVAARILVFDNEGSV